MQCCGQLEESFCTIFSIAPPSPGRHIGKQLWPPTKWDSHSLSNRTGYCLEIRHDWVTGVAGITLCSGIHRLHYLPFALSTVFFSIYRNNTHLVNIHILAQMFLKWRPLRVSSIHQVKGHYNDKVSAAYSRSSRVAAQSDQSQISLQVTRVGKVDRQEDLVWKQEREAKRSPFGNIWNLNWMWITW